MIRSQSLKNILKKSTNFQENYSDLIEGRGEFPVLYYPRCFDERWINYQLRTFLLDWEIHREYKKSAGLRLLVIRIVNRLKQVRKGDFTLYQHKKTVELTPISRKFNPYHNRKNNDPTLNGQKLLLNNYLSKLTPKEYGKAMLQKGILVEDEAIYRPSNYGSMEREKKIRYSTLIN